MKYTQGEWKVSGGTTEGTIQCDPESSVCTKHGNEIARIFGKTIEESKANAKLIAAAPDMLEALQKAVEVIERMSDEYSAIAGHHASYTNGEAKIIEGAIKKATE
jgi:N-acetylneuraminic acid mutarotase